MLVVNLKAFKDETIMVETLQDHIDVAADAVDLSDTEEEREADKQYLADLRRMKGAFEHRLLFRSTELVERVLGYFWDRFESEGSDNPDVEWLMDEMDCDEEELREVFNHLGYTEE